MFHSSLSNTRNNLNVYQQGDDEQIGACHKSMQFSKKKDGILIHTANE